MKRLWGIIILGIALSFLLAFATSQASAQLLDDVFFKLKCKFKTYVVDNGTGDVTKFNFPATLYAHFRWEGADYRVNYWYKMGDGSWDDAPINDGVDPYPDNTSEKAMLAWLGPPLYYGGGRDLNISANVHLLMKMKNKKIILKGTGNVDGKDGSDNVIYGWVRINGKSVDESDLPFPPP
jgi:hypothetical protein